MYLRTIIRKEDIHNLMKILYLLGVRIGNFVPYVGSQGVPNGNVTSCSNMKRFQEESY